MNRLLLAAALSLTLVPASTSAAARSDSRSAQTSMPEGTRDDEFGHDDDDAPASDASPGDEERGGDADAAPRYSGRRAPSDVDVEPPERDDAGELGPPPTRSIALDIGGAVVTLGGWAYPRIPFKGSTDGALGLFPADGAGGAFKLHYDFVAMDLDWRIGVNGALPSYLGAGATVGVRKDVGPWENPRIIARGGGGLELMVAEGDNDSVFLAPVFIAEGETALEFTVVPDRLTLGGVFELGLRYGLPLGVGFSVGGYLRANVLF